MSNPFENHVQSLESPATVLYAITPSDVIDLVMASRALRSPIRNIALSSVTTPDAGTGMILPVITSANSGPISLNLMTCSLVAVYNETVDTSAQNETSGDQSDVNVNTTTGRHLLVGCMSYSATSGVTITDDATPALDVDLHTDDMFVISVQDVATGQSPRTVNTQASPSTQIATIAVAVSPT